MPTETLFRSVLVVHEGERFRVVHRSLLEGGPSTGSRRLSPLVVQARLDEWLCGPAGEDLRDLAAELLGWTYSTPRSFDADRLLRDVLRREFDTFSGSLVVVEEPAAQFQVLVGEEVPVLEVEKEEVLDWVTIELIDDEDAPIRDAPFEIELSDGSFQTGRTDASGQATFQGIPRGICTVRFTEHAAEKIATRQS